MLRIQQLMNLHRLMAPAGDEGSDMGGTGSGGDASAIAAATATAEKAIADAATAASAAAKAEADKGAKPSEAEAKLLKDMMKHKTRATDLEALLAQSQAALKSFEGIDVVKVKAAQAEKEEIETKRLIAAGDFERLTKQMGERHVAEKTTLEQSLAAGNTANASLQKQIADLTVGNSFSTSAFVKGELITPSKARVLFGPHFEFKDGKVIGFDKPAGASDRTMLVNSAGDPLSFEQAMEKIVDADPDRDEIRRSKMKPGAGSSTTKGAKKADSDQRAQLSGIEKIAAGLKALAK